MGNEKRLPATSLFKAPMPLYAQLFIFAPAALLVGFVFGWKQASSASETQLEQIVAMSWGGGFEDAFYGAHVYFEPQDNGYSVKARVYIGRGMDYFHDCGELGKVWTEAAAVAKWGAIDWREDGLHIGRGTNHYFLPKAELERHR